MQNNGCRIIIDTNLWISFLITGEFSKLDDIIFSRKSVLIFSDELLSDELLEEFLDVAKRPKLKKFFKKAVIENILETIDDHAEFITVISIVEVCRDPKDNFLLSLSTDGKADFLLTGDRIY